MPTGVFLLTLAFTILAVFAIEGANQERANAQTKEITNTIATAIERRVGAHTAYLRSGAVLLGSVPAIDQQVFREFALESRVDENIRGSEGIAWAQRVPVGQLAEFEARQRTLGRPDFTIHRLPSADPDVAIIATYLEPMMPRNRDWVGFDMYSEPVRRAAMIDAMRVGRPTATGHVELLQLLPTTLRHGFVVYMPVFEPAGTGLEALRGFISSAFNANVLLNGIVEQERISGVGMALYDGEVAPANLLAASRTFTASARSHVVPVVVARHRFVLAVQQTDRGVLSVMSVLTLLFGLLVAALLTVVAALVSRKAAEDRAALQWFQEQASIRNSLTRELNHRVKNTLANVLSIIALTRRRAADVDSFADSINGRIRALSATHDLLTHSEWGTTLIRAVVAAELAPYAQDGEHLVELQGPEVELAPNDALSLGLAIHELATNAAKYGALSVPDGKVRVQWKMISGELARIDWTERGGPPVSPERRRGFGTELIEKIVAHELGQPVDLKFEPEGVSCALTVPVRKPVAFRMRAPRKG